jgi:hypothetical protein
MKKTKQNVLIGIGVIVLFWILWQGFQAIKLKVEQNELGKELGVNAKEYSKIFPDDYFYSKLTTDMNIVDVHKIILGYKKVYNCGSNLELYLYFNADPEKAIRFGVIYNYGDGMKFMHVEYTDQNSGYPNINDYCKEGLLPAKN